MAEYRDDRYYVESHEWILTDGDTATVGISDFAQEELGDIVYVEADSVGESLEKGEIFGSVESVKVASDLFMPIDGEVLEFNEVLEEEPELINEDAYAAWIIKIKVSDPSQIDDLLDAEKYQEIAE
ncbi:MAG TPA: glycine cleavage system protein GcvH [Clostridiaceae bacterium]|nr:glycine cleavage system protein GcvH [Clostridiaceae bacterium]